MSNVTTEKFIEKANKIHGDKYDYSKVIYEHSKKNVIITCPIHGEFQQTPNNHLNGQGCPHCLGKKKPTTDEFIERLEKIHGDKYDYSKVDYVNNHTKVTVTCKKHGDFQMLPMHLLKGSGCKQCHFERLSQKFSMKEEEFIERANKIHNNKYVYGKYNGYDKPMTVICPIHGEFQQTPHSHLNGCGCKQCSNERQHNERTKGFGKFVEEANKIHNNKYKYLEPYVNKDTPITIICPIHGEFRQTPKIHLMGSGCQKCKSSKLEAKVARLLRDNGITFIEQCGKKELEWIKQQRLDFYIPQANIAIECQGEQHYKPSNFGGKDKDPNELLKRVQERDERKRKLCEEHNVRLLYFADKQYDENVITNETELIEKIKANTIYDLRL